MAWDTRKLSIEIVEEFVAAQVWLAYERGEIELGRHTELLVRHRQRNRDYMREKRGGLKGHSYNDGRWRGVFIISRISNIS